MYFTRLPNWHAACCQVMSPSTKFSVLSKKINIVTGPRTEGIGSLYFGSKPGLGVISRLIEGPVVNVSIGRRMVQMAPKVSSVKVFKTEFYKVLEENGWNKSLYNLTFCTAFFTTFVRFVKSWDIYTKFFLNNDDMQLGFLPSRSDWAHDQRLPFLI